MRKTGEKHFNWEPFLAEGGLYGFVCPASAARKCWEDRGHKWGL